jgi:catechol-2,3-dioxygenase
MTRKNDHRCKKLAVLSRQRVQSRNAEPLGAIRLPFCHMKSARKSNGLGFERRMRINHLNLCVPDVPRTAQFFAEYFGFQMTEQKGREALCVLFDDSGFAFILTNFDRSTKPEYPCDFHIGFIQDGKEQVEAIYQRLKTAGYVEKAPQSMHGSWGFYFYAPGGIHVEVSCPLDR